MSLEKTTTTMIARRVILGVSVLASFATACTALVAARLSETNDYAVDGSTLTASSSGSADDKCDLLADNYTTYDANPCSTCISTKCTEAVDFACQKGTKNTAKSWFSTMKECAQNPWNGAYPPNSGASFYSCKGYAQAQPPISSNGDDSQKKRESEICINQNCMQGDTPECRLCEISKQKTGVSDRALLRDDPCGSCLVDNCGAEIVACCDEGPRSDIIEACAFTADPWNKTVCKELGKTNPDGGDDHSRYGDAGDECLSRISTCFKTHCASMSACK